MRFRLNNLNPIYRICLTGLSSSTRNRPLPNPNPNPLSHHYHLIQQPSLLLPRRWHFGHSHRHDRDVAADGDDDEKIFRLGLASDILLAAGKGLAGYLSGSTAIVADAAHSVSDVVLSGVALLSYKVASTPKDEEHPYGHGKFETLGALGISCMLLATAGGIAWHAFDLLLDLMVDHGHNNHDGGHHHGIDMDYPVLALAVTVMSISIKEGLYWMTKRAGERRNSGLMMANAWHHRADAVSSVVALIGVGGSILGMKLLDPLAGVVVSGMILKAGLESGYQSILELVDAALPSKELEPIKQTILQVEGVKGCHRLRGRRAGSSLHLDVHIVVDPFCSVSAAHDIGENVRQQIHQSHPEVAELFIHIDPEINPEIISEQENRMRPTCERSSSEKDNDINIEAAVSEFISSKFPQIMVVEHITRHSLQGKVLLQVEVSMPPDMLIRDAMEVAKMAEDEILKAQPDIVHVSIQLCLGHLIPQLNSTKPS